MPKSSPLSTRFWAKVDRNGPVVREDLGPCWVWTGAKLPTGYGQIHAYGRTEQATRIAWWLHSGEQPQAMDVLHRCDNPPCVRPDHLFLGTAADNLADMAAKGRSGRAGLRGEEIGNSILNAESVVAIRALCALGIQQRVIARQYGISQPTVSAINVRRIWRHV